MVYKGCTRRFCILSEPERSAAVFSHLQYAAMDGLACVVAELQLLVVEQWYRLKEMVQQQLLWLVNEGSALPDLFLMLLESYNRHLSKCSG